MARVIEPEPKLTLTLKPDSSGPIGPKESRIRLDLGDGHPYVHVPTSKDPKDLLPTLQKAYDGSDTEFTLGPGVVEKNGILYADPQTPHIYRRLRQVA